MSSDSLEKLSPKEYILIKGARIHNLKNVDVAIPRNKLVVITGLSGSGKSSLAFDTLYAEGQRRYVESLSSYARQFLGKVEKPDVDYIKGVAPAIAIEQKVNTSNSRSTVGTSTEIYDYLKLLFARIGKTYSPITGNIVQRDSIEDILKFILELQNNSKAFLIAEKQIDTNEYKQALELLMQQGYSRAFINKEIVWLEDLIQLSKPLKSIPILVDRFIVNDELEEQKSRISDSIETAFFEGKNACEVFTELDGKWTKKTFNNLFEENGISFIEPSLHLFSFNNPMGACPSCEGFGKIIGIDEDLVIPNKSLSVYQDAIVCWKGDKMKKWKDRLIANASDLNFPIHKAIYDLSEEQYALLWTGNKRFKGLNQFFEYLGSKSYKIQYRVMLARYRGRTTCPACKGTRIRKEAGYVKIAGKSIQDLVLLSVKELSQFFTNLSLDKHQEKIAKRILTEIGNRLQYLEDVGLSYLSLNRSSASLSGGESQRINLSSSLGSSLVGSMYILDEPSIGLHSKDTERLIGILQSLKNLGNTVIVVEHDEDIIRAADHVIDLGPEAGYLGGELVFSGNQKQLIKANTLTSKYINGDLQVVENKKTRKWNNAINFYGARENNLKGIDVKIPLNVMTVVSGLSGSGKSSLVKGIIYPALQKHFGNYGEKTGIFNRIEGELDQISEVQFIDQNPIGKSSRSNPVTYIKAYDEIRNLYANLGLSVNRNYKPAHFSFNVEGGRCETCKGEGEITEEMQFMADVHLICDECGGKRFKEEILEVKFHQKSIADVLDLTVDEAVQFFEEYSEDKLAQKVAQKLKVLLDVGLGYVKLGQSSGTLSGGEAQRIKLASYLGKGRSNNSILFIFDEPTTGLHFHDIKKLLNAFDALIDYGHSLLVVEHNPAVIKYADWNIDLGPEGGKNGGYLLFEGVLEEFKKCEQSVTKNYL